MHPGSLLKSSTNLFEIAHAAVGAKSVVFPSCRRRMLSCWEQPSSYSPTARPRKRKSSACSSRSSMRYLCAEGDVSESAACQHFWSRAVSGLQLLLCSRSGSERLNLCHSLVMFCVCCWYCCVPGAQERGQIRAMWGLVKDSSSAAQTNPALPA